MEMRSFFAWLRLSFPIASAYSPFPFLSPLFSSYTPLMISTTPGGACVPFCRRRRRRPSLPLAAASFSLPPRHALCSLPLPGASPLTHQA